MIECIRFKSHPKGCLCGFADLRIPSMGIEIFGCSLYQKNGHRWVSLPTKEYTDENGEKKFAPVVRFIEKERMEKFSQLAIQAIERKCAEQNIQLYQKPDTVDDLFSTTPF